VRVSEYPSTAGHILALTQAAHPDFDPTRFEARLRVLREGLRKYVWASDGRNALYDLGSDPGETRNRIDALPEAARQMDARLARIFEGLGVGEAEAPAASDDAEDPGLREMLEALGYSGR